MISLRLCLISRSLAFAFIKTLRALNNPAYVLLLINPIDRLIAVQANDGTDARAHRVGIRASKKSYEIYSMALLNKLRLCSEWDEKQSYRIIGNHIDELDLVQFKICDSFKFNGNTDESTGTDNDSC